MGIIIAPIFLGVIVIFIISLIKIIKWNRAQLLDLKNILLGLFFSLLIFLGIVISYYFQEKAWGLSTVFRVPICAIYLPYAICTSFQLNLKIQQSLVLSIVFSGVIMVIFSDQVFGIPDYLGINKHY